VTTTTLLPCLADDECDDGNDCTVDVCAGRRGCRHDDLDRAAPEGTRCAIDNAWRVLREQAPLPVCSGRCPDGLVRRLDRIESLVAVGLAATRPAKCRSRLRRASKQSARLYRRLERLLERGAVVPVERGGRLQLEIERVRIATSVLGAVYCGRFEGPPA